MPGKPIWSRSPAERNFPQLPMSPRVAKLLAERNPIKYEACPNRDGLGHWWILESLTARTGTNGKCKECGEERMFNPELPSEKTQSQWPWTGPAGLSGKR